MGGGALGGEDLGPVADPMGLGGTSCRDDGCLGEGSRGDVTSIVGWAACFEVGVGGVELGVEPVCWDSDEEEEVAKWERG